MRGTLARSSVPDSRITPYCGVCTGQTGKNLENRDNPQLTWLPHMIYWCVSNSYGCWAVQRSLRCGCVRLLNQPACLRYGLRPPEKVQPSTNLHRVEKRLMQYIIITAGITELACGSQAFIATLLFDPSMSALPIIPKQNSVSVGLFTH